MAGKSAYKLAPMPTTASDLASARGLTQMERNGLGGAWQENFVRRALLANYDPASMMEGGGANLLGAGMEFSGAYQAKLPGAVAAKGYEIQSGAASEAKQISDQASDQAFSTLLSLRQHEDSMNMQRDIAQKQINLQWQGQQRTWWDYLMGAASIGTAVGSLT